MSEMLTGPKKIVDGLTEVFRGLTQMCEGILACRWAVFD